MRIEKQVLKGYSVEEIRQGIQRLFLRWTGEVSGYDLTASPSNLTEDGALSDAIGQNFRAGVPLARAYLLHYHPEVRRDE